MNDFRVKIWKGLAVGWTINFILLISGSYIGVPSPQMLALGVSAIFGLIVGLIHIRRSWAIPSTVLLFLFLLGATCQAQDDPMTRATAKPGGKEILSPFLNCQSTSTP